MKQYLNFEVNGQIISRKDNISPVAKTRNYFYAHFDFMTDEWEGIKTALFTNGKYNKSAVIDDNGDCLIPWEFWDVEHEVIGAVSVFCGDLYTANEAYVRIRKSGYHESDASEPPSPDVYQQILKMIDNSRIKLVSGGTFEDWKE